MALREITLELGSDESGFVIEGIAPALLDTPAIPANTLLSWWADEEPEFESFLVRSGSQWGPFAVVVRVHAADPGPVGDEWEDVVDVSVSATDAVVISEIVDGPCGDLAAQPGTQRMRVSARGRTESAARDASIPDDDEEEVDDPLEHYLVELWPASEAPPQVVRETSIFAHEVNDPPEPVHPPERDAGLAAAWAIVRDLREETGARALPGELTTIDVSVDVAGTRTRVFNRVRHAFGWPTCHGGSGSIDPNTEYYDATLPEYDRYEQVGHIVTTDVQVTKPRQIVKRWNWVHPRERGPLDKLPRLLANDSTVTITVTPAHDSGEDPRCIVRLKHEGAPGVWADDLEHLWRWHLVQWAANP